MSEDTPKCAKLHHLEKIVFAATCHLTHYQYVPRPEDLKFSQK